MRMASVEMPSHISTVVPVGTRCLGLANPVAYGLNLVVLGALPPADAVALSVASLEVDRDVYVAAVARVAGESLHVLSEAAPAVHGVEGEAQPVAKPLTVLVDAGGLPSGVGEDSTVGGAVWRSLAGHQRYDGGLDTPTEAEYLEGWFGPHQASASARSSAGVAFAAESPSGGVRLSLAVCSSSRVKRRLRRSWASGAGLQLIATTRSSSASLPEVFGSVLLLESFNLPLS